MNSQNNNNILFVIGGLRAGGAEKVCVTLINEFFRKGFNVSLMVLNLEGSKMLQHLDPNIKIYNLGLKHARSSFFPIYRVLRKLEINTCLSFNFQLSVQLILVKKMFGFKFLIFSRGINTFSKKISQESSFRHKYINANIIKWLYRKSDFFIAQSSGMKIDMIQNLKVPPDKLRVIFNPVISFESSNKPALSNSDNPTKKEILFVGALKEQKNISFLLHSIKDLSKYRTDFIFRIVGDGKLRVLLENECKELSLEDFVIFEGFCSTPWEYYKTADVFVLGSWYEGFPNVLIEALSYGIPVVSVDCLSGPSDIIENEINGFLVSNYSTIEFSSKVSESLDKNWSCEEIEKSINKFSFKVIFNDYLEYLTHAKKK